MTLINSRSLLFSTKLSIKRQFTARLWEVKILQRYIIRDIIHIVPRQTNERYDTLLGYEFCGGRLRVRPQKAEGFGRYCRPCLSLRKERKFFSCTQNS